MCPGEDSIVDLDIWAVCMNEYDMALGCLGGGGGGDGGGGGGDGGGGGGDGGGGGGGGVTSFPDA